MIALDQIQQMPLHEKLRLMEALWEGIARQEDQIEIPQWHKDLLDRREELMRQGKGRVIEWEVAKQRINDAIS